MKLTLEMLQEVREYCAANHLDPATTSVTFNAGGVITGHEVVASAGFMALDRCCCGVPDCDSGPAERLEAWGIVPDQVTVTYDRIPLGVVDCE